MKQVNFLKTLKEEYRPDISVMPEIDAFITKINDSIKKTGIKATCVKGGSTAKGTFVKGDFDVDCFIKFDYSYKKENLSLLLKDILKGYDKELIHGSRDYYHVKNKYVFEIVPVLDITDPKKAINVTDMSPLHVEWVRKRLSEGMEDEIRLAKMFCKAQGVYGAESYIKGFSGHVLDILIIHYGGFLELLKNAKKWKAKVIIDPEQNYKRKQDIIYNMNSSKSFGPMIIVDPVLPIRNASAALGDDAFNIFIKKAEEFLKNPDKSFFVKPDISYLTIKKESGNDNLIYLDVTTKDGKIDVVGAKLLKTYEYIKNEIRRNDFVLNRSGWDWDKDKNASFHYIMSPEPLEPEKEILGPPLSKPEHVNAFKDKYNKVFEKEGRLYAIIKRKYVKAENLIKDLINKKYEKIKTIKIHKE